MRMIGQEQVADLFGVASKTIVEWQELGFPVAMQGGRGVSSEYESTDCIRWLVDREVRKVRAESPRDRLFRLQADDLELKLAEKRGHLVPTSAIEPSMKAAVVAARERIRSEPARMAAAMEGMDRAAREALLRNLFDEALDQLAAWQPNGHQEGDLAE
ncbi:MAG: terminase small subunit [Pseudomonadales bacterium]|nr:terminase small subunit [Pseudomonadales bacterium]